MRETAIRMAFTLSASALAALIAVPVVVAQDEAGAAIAVGAVGLILVFYVFIGLLALASIGIWIWALVDCIQREFPAQNDKIMWILIVALLGWLGGIIYLIAGRPKGWKPGEQPPA